MTKEVNNKVYMEADIKLIEETESLRKEVSSIIELPSGSEKQPDLQYFTALFVSSGSNLNLAHFLPSELVMAANTVSSKAVDVEHSESDIIGHIYAYEFIDTDGHKLSLKELSSMEKASLDKQDMHIVIAGIIYKSRFPEIAKEIASGEWMVSMEAYFNDYDVLIGDTILDKKEAEMLGFDTSKESSFGKLAKIIKEGIEIASGKAARVLRDICFTGVGIVKNPANPPSVVLETAKEKIEGTSKEESDYTVLNYDDLEDETSDKNTTNNVTLESIDSSVNSDKEKEESELVYNDTVGICVNYKKRLIDATFEDTGTEVIKKDWCTMFDKSCTSFSRDTTDIDCLRNKAVKTAKAYVSKLLNIKDEADKIDDLVMNLNSKINKASKICNN